MDIALNIVDAGARYGIFPAFEPLKNVAGFFLFEPDIEAAEKLKRKYEKFANIEVIARGLGKKAGKERLFLRNHRGLSGTVEVDSEIFKEFDYMKEESESSREIEVDIVTIDDYLTDDIHFLKIDTEGTELEVLQGAKRMLESSVIGLKIEVNFYGFYRNQPLFGDIHRYLAGFGFKLLNLDYEGRTTSESKFTLPDKYGQLLACDAAWIREKRHIYGRLGKDRERLTMEILRYAMFLMLNNATDMALSVLHEAADLYGADYSIYRETGVYKKLDELVLALFKKMSYLPYITGDELREAYRKIFLKNLPQWHEYYDSNTSGS